MATGHYTHFAHDWQAGQPQSGCSPCGSSRTEASVGALALVRIHKPGFEAFPSTLGNGVFYGSDISLTAIPTGGFLVHDPAHYALLRYHATGQPVEPDLPPLRFTDANGTTVSGPVDGGRAILTHAGLGRRIFECWSPGVIDPFGGLVPVGRLIREEERQGNGWTHTYKTGAGVSRFIRDASEDQFSNRIVFSYSTHPTTGLPERMVKARLPGGLQDIEYTYSGSQLSQIRYPNGDVSRFDGFTGTGTYRIDDVGAEGTHRRKTVTLQVSGSQLQDVLEEQSRRAQMAGLNWINDNQLVRDVKLTSLRTGTNEMALSRSETAQADGIEVEAVTGASRIKMRLDANRFPQETSVLNGATWEVEESYLGMGRRVAKTTDAAGRSTWHLPDANGWVNREVRPNGAITTTQRGPGGVPLSVTDGLGRTTTSTYDANGNRLTQTQASGTPLAATTTWTYNTRGQPLTMTDPLGNVTTYEYDPRGYLVAERLPSVPGQPEAVKRFVFNTAGQLAQSTDPEGRTATYGYDLRGRHVSTTYADGTSDTTTYGTGQDANLVVARTNRNGVVTTYSYDAAGRQIAIVEAAGTSAAAVTTITYVPGTTLEATRTTDATVTTTTYDAYQRPSVTTVQPRSDLTLSTRTFYDAAGQVIRRLDPYGRNAYFVYDVNGREIRQVTELVPGGVTNPTTISTLVRSTATNPAFTIQDQEWDAEGQLLARVDGRGVRTSFAYDALGRMTSQTQAVGTAEAATTTWTYDLAGRRLTETSPGGTVTAWAYDARGQEISRTEGVGTTVEATTTVTSSPTGKVAAVTDALGRTTVSAYGVCCDRLASITDAAGYNTSFGYDAVGNRTSVTDPNGLTTSTAYDALNRPVSITDGAGGRTSLTYLNRATNLPTSGVALPGVAWPTLLNTLKLSGSARGSATVITDPVGTKSVEVRDGLGRPVARINALGQTTLLTYDTVVNGLVESTVTDPTAAVTRARADGAGQVREQVDALGALTTLTYDAAGNRRSVRNAVQVGQDWTYDLQGRRLTEADTAGGHTGTQYHADGQVASVTNGMNEVTRFFYDARGRKTSEQDPVNGITAFAYDAVGNLLSITDAQGGVTRYRYDALNRLTREDFPGPTGGLRVYTYDAGGRLTGRSERLAAPGGE